MSYVEEQRKEAQKWGICKDKIVRSDIQMVGKIEQTLEKIRKEIAQNSHELKELNKKKMKNVTQQDIDNMNKLNRMFDEINWWDIEELREKIRRIHERISKHPHFDKKELDIEEKEGYVSRVENMLNEFKSIRELVLTLLSKSENKNKNDFLDKKGQEIKDELLKPQDEVSCVVMRFGNEEKVISKREKELIEKGILLAPAYEVYHDDFLDHFHIEVKHYKMDELEFLDYDNPETTSTQKHAIREAEERISSIRNSNDRKYGKKIKVSVPLRMVYDLSTGKFKSEDSAEIITTQRELVNAGIMPENFEYKTLTRIDRRDIAKAAKSRGITKEEMKLAEKTLEAISKGTLEKEER